MEKSILIIAEDQIAADKISYRFKQANIFGFGLSNGYVSNRVAPRDQLVYKGPHWNDVYDEDFVKNNYEILYDSNSLISDIKRLWKLRIFNLTPAFRKVMKNLPHFGLRIPDGSNTPYWTVYYNQGGINRNFKTPEELREKVRELQQHAQDIETELAMSATYPSLYFSVNGDYATVWVKREIDGIVHDGTAVGTFDLRVSNIKELLRYANSQATIARAEGHFYCTGCQKAYPREEYGYYYFAAVMCKTCLAANPEWERRARAESYN